MNKLLSFLCLLGTFFSAGAHSLETTAIDLYQVEGLWVLQYTISQEGANIALQRAWEEGYSNMTAEEFKEAYVAYVKSRTALEVDGVSIALDMGGIKLGNHESRMTFLLENFPATFQTITARIHVFGELDDQHNIFRLTQNDRTTKAILKRSNNFQASVHADGSVEYGPFQNREWMVWFAVALAAALVLLLLGKRKLLGGSD